MIQFLIFVSDGYVWFFPCNIFVADHFSTVLMFFTFPITFNLCKFLGAVPDIFQECISAKVHLCILLKKYC